MVSPTRILLHDFTTPQSSSGGSLCDLPKSLGAQVLFLLLPPSRGRPGCTHSRVAEGTPLRLPSDSANTQSTQKNPTAKGDGHPGGTMVAAKTLVFNGPIHVSTPSLPSTSVLPDAPSGTNSAPSTSQAPINRLEIERQHLMNLGLPSEVIGILLASRRDSTIRIYNSTWRTFVIWCSSIQVDPLTASPELALQFLQHGLEMGLRPATLRRQVATLESVLSLCSRDGAASLSHNPLVRRFLKGATSLNPAQQHRFPT